MANIKFDQFSLHINLTFWSELEKTKLSIWKTTEPEIDLYAFTELFGKKNNLNIITLSNDSFNTNNKDNSHAIPIIFQNFNTIQQLKNFDESLSLQKIGKLLLKKIRNGMWDDENFNLLFMITFADLKTFDYYYRLFFPTIDLESNMIMTKISIKKYMTLKNYTTIYDYAIEHNKKNGIKPFIIKIISDDEIIIYPFTSSNISIQNTIIVYCDLSHSKYPNWSVQNIISTIRIYHPKTTSLTFLGIRQTLNNSIMFNCEFQALSDDILDKTDFKIIGYENSKIEHLSLGYILDPIKIAESSSKLNLSLMKWRMAPEIELNSIAASNVLILGSGTLGCNIARHLLMWGVTNITFVDRGTVSFSNPIRQTLFEFNDALEPKKNKAIVAADALKRILPTINSKGIELTINMPGHRIDNEQEEICKNNIKQLEELIISHDVIFLLTDNRESRWLPTVIATVYNKPIINVALGFDSYVVMRHGLPTQNETRMGCYFCNDVVAPIDSLTGRSLDQQCTVTRPAVSAIASSMAVEILAALYNHPLKFLCPGYTEDSENSEDTCVLGIIPHQIRGNVYRYSTQILHGKHYNKCVACSDIICEKYKTDKYDFIIKCINNPELLREITGLKEECDKIIDNDYFFD